MLDILYIENYRQNIIIMDDGSQIIKLARSINNLNDQSRSIFNLILNND